uniref:Mannose-P-dolichol utilization defect 1 protein homolog n=1 Tax=Acrobeloides nanus TaxID=290746 RepID=A0A914BU95_9BILA
MFLLVPQILKIFASKSGRGISLSSQLLGLLAAAGTSAYSYEKGFVFSQWGDSLFVTIQMMFIIMQILYYSDASAYAFSFFSVCWMLTLAVAYHYVPLAILTTIQATTIPIVSVSKGIQIWTNHSNKSTGQLSLISVALQFFGCLARIFTSVQETGDNLVIGSFIVAAFLNGIIFAQMFIYWDETTRQKKPAKHRE